MPPEVIPKLDKVPSMHEQLDRHFDRASPPAVCSEQLDPVNCLQYATSRL